MDTYISTKTARMIKINTICGTEQVKEKKSPIVPKAKQVTTITHFTKNSNWWSW